MCAFGISILQKGARNSRAKDALRVFSNLLQQENTQKETIMRGGEGQGSNPASKYT